MRPDEVSAIPGNLPLDRSEQDWRVKQLMSLAKIGVMRFCSFALGETLAAPKFPTRILAYPGSSQ